MEVCANVDRGMKMTRGRLVWWTNRSKSFIKQPRMTNKQRAEADRKHYELNYDEGPNTTTVPVSNETPRPHHHL